ncbi:hypothetical protein RA8CHR_00547 [Variovorax sp. RA8]|nr:hypothetical protein RA8CHR_00547 [Variovorax sp. RA8]
MAAGSKMTGALGLAKAQAGPVGAHWQGNGGVASRALCAQAGLHGRKSSRR